nr:ribosome maturation protein SBDS [Tanacetum cinerariifolium]
MKDWRSCRRDHGSDIVPQAIVLQKTINHETQRMYTISMIKRLMHEIHFGVDAHGNSKKQGRIPCLKQ